MAVLAFVDRLDHADGFILDHQRDAEDRLGLEGKRLIHLTVDA